MDFFVNIGNNDFILYISLIAQKIEFFGKKITQFKNEVFTEI